MSTDTDTTDTRLRIVEAWDRGAWDGRGIVYEGTPAAFIAHGFAEPEHFTNKSGTKSFKNADGRSRRLTRRAHGLWRVLLYLEAGETPVIPEPDEIVRYKVACKWDSEWVQLTAASALGSGISVHSCPTKKGGRFTTYAGTKAQLIGAGLAVASMFPSKGGRTQTRKWSSPEQGEWQIRCSYSDGERQELWEVTYWHEAFEMPPEVKREAQALSIYNALKRHFGDDDNGDRCYG